MYLIQKKGAENTMGYMSTKEASEKWGYSVRTIQKWCREGILTQEIKAEKNKCNGHWQIPVDMECPKPIKKSES